jgi:four helix bundle protein
MKTVEDLEVYKKAHLFTLALYKATARFPVEERYGLCSQIRRAAVSINANLMEGSHRATKREYHHFASISRGSTGELKYLILVSHDLGYIDEAEYHELSTTADEISRMLDAMMRSLEK